VDLSITISQETPPGLETLVLGAPYPDPSWSMQWLPIPVLVPCTLFPSLCQGRLGFGSERRIWSGFEYAMGLAWGLNRNAADCCCAF
jgi:hypothetical protein